MLILVMINVYIKAAGLSKFGKSKQRLYSLIKDACADMNHPLEEIDAVYIGMMNPEEFIGIGNYASFIADKIGLSGVPSVRIETASSTGAAVLLQAYAAIKSGLYKNVLAVAAEKMTHLPTPQVTKIISEVIDPSERKTGASMPSLAALVTNRFMYEQKIKKEKFQQAMCSVAMKSHKYGALNPYAQFRKEITEEKYFDSKLVSDPLRLYDCSPISDGAAAVILSNEKGDVEIAGVGQGTDKQALSKRDSITSFASTRKAAADAYNLAGFGPSSIDFSEMHDAFTPFEIMGLLETGLVKVKDILKFYEDKEDHNTGRLPVNISGGLKSRGHPVGASGLAQIAESYRIMTEKYEKERMPAKYDTCLTHSIGGLASNNFVILMKRPDIKIKILSKKHIVKKEEKKESKDKRFQVFSYTRLYSPPSGFPTPLDLVILRRKGRLALARAETEQPLKIGQYVNFTQKVDGSIVVEKSSFLDLIKKKKKDDDEISIP